MDVQPEIDQQFAAAQRAQRDGELDAAERGYRAILARQPEHAGAHHFLGLLYSQRGRMAVALEHLRRACRLNPKDAALYNNLGEALRRAGDLAASRRALQQALALAPGFAEAHYNLGNTLKALGEFEAALRHYRQATALRPGYVSAYYNLGNTLLELGQLNPAAAVFQRALDLRPGFAEAHNNLGALLYEQGRIAEAVGHFRQATQQRQGFAEALRNLGAALARQGRSDEARQSYAAAVAAEPDNDLLRLVSETHCPQVFTSNTAIDAYRAGLTTALARWRERPPRLDLRRVHLDGGEVPFGLAYQGRDDRPLKEAYAALFEGQLPVEPLRAGRGKPHIGVVVTQGHEGVFLKCMRGIMRRLPLERLRVTIIASRRGGAALLQRELASPGLEYLPLSPRCDEALAQIQAGRFDLLHYWEVGSDPLNYFLALARLAPVQCATWGWPVTSGSPQIDYFVSSELLEHAASDHHYSERLVRLKRLPTCYPRPQHPGRQPARARFGLHENWHIYLCAQNLRKLHPDFDPLMAEILRRDPQGRVVLLEDVQAALGELLRRRFQQHLPDVAGRVLFVPRSSYTEYQALTATADVILDTLHYGGGANTTYDALALGIPIVTLPTHFQRGRYTLGAYRQMGVLDAVVDSPAAYVATAVRLGSDRVARQELSSRIDAASAVLFDDNDAVIELADFFERAVEGTR